MKLPYEKIIRRCVKWKLHIFPITNTINFLWAFLEKIHEPSCSERCKARVDSEASWNQLATLLACTVLKQGWPPNSYSWHSSLENWAISKDKFESLYLSAIPPELGWSRMIYSWYVFASGTFKYRLRSSRGKIMTRNQSRLNLQLLLSHGQKNSNA